MTRILIYAVVILAAAGGGAYYVIHRNEVSINPPVQASPAQPQKSEIVIERKKEDEELQRKRLEGIGSVKKLKPVEIGPTLEQEARTKKQ